MLSKGVDDDGGFPPFAFSTLRFFILVDRAPVPNPTTTTTTKDEYGWEHEHEHERDTALKHTRSGLATGN
jgi:hypothetical protein